MWHAAKDLRLELNRGRLRLRHALYPLDHLHAPLTCFLWYDSCVHSCEPGLWAECYVHGRNWETHFFLCNRLTESCCKWFICVEISGEKLYMLTVITVMECLVSKPCHSFSAHALKEKINVLVSLPTLSKSGHRTPPRVRFVNCKMVRKLGGGTSTLRQQSAISANHWRITYTDTFQFLHGLTDTSGGRGDGCEVTDEKAGKPLTTIQHLEAGGYLWGRTTASSRTCLWHQRGMFQTGPRSISSHGCGDQNQWLKTRHDLFPTLAKCAQTYLEHFQMMPLKSEP